VFHPPPVNVSCAVETVPSAGIELLMSTFTVPPAGLLFSTTVNVAVPPASVVFPEIALTLIPAVSLSTFVTDTSLALIPVYTPSAPVAAAVTMLYATSSSSTNSSTPVTVTVWAVFQLAAVNVSELVETVPSAVSLDVMPIDTFAVG
jgi:hypothetical protein